MKLMRPAPLKGEDMFRVLADTIPQIVWITDPKGQAIYYNKYWYEYSGADIEQTNKEGWFQIIHPEDKYGVIKSWQEAIKTGKPYEREYRLKNIKTGEYRWFLGRGVPIRDNDNKINQWVGTSTDIHSQKITLEAQEFLAKASKALSESLNYRLTLKRVASLAVPHIADWCSVEFLEDDKLATPIIAHRDPKKVKWALNLTKNRKIDMEASSGLPQVLRSKTSELYPLITDQMLKAAAKTKKDYALMKKIGFTSVMIVPIIIDNKAIAAIQFVSTESKKQFNRYDLQMAEELATRSALAIQNANLYEAVKQRELQFKALFDANIVGVLFTRLNGTIKDANDAFLQMTGYSQSDLEHGHLNWKTITPSGFKSENKRIIKEILKHGIISPFEKEYIKKDGSQVPVIEGSALLDKKTEDCITFVLDITERKRLEQRKDEFIGIASHELKTPLTSIKGYVQILERIIEQMGDEQLKTYVKKTNTYINRLNSLISDLLDVSKIQAGKMELNFSRFRFDTLVKDAVEAVTHTSPSHKIQINGKTNTVIKGDKHRLEQVFTNLLTNAIKYSPNADKIIVKVLKHKGELTISVQDFGVGIAKKDQSKLFQRFYRVESTAKKFSGLGIGLYISSEIIQRHGGKMWVESIKGKGATFYFTIPTKKQK